MFHVRFEEAADRVLADDSMDAAHSLEGVVLNDYPDDVRLNDLLEALAFYNPSGDPPYVNAASLRSVVAAARIRLRTPEPE